ncbi:MAG TPA: DNA-protecting protein DprA [Anaerolineae bacterium]|nr:DNA-protecting protein DprA [Anaerolineae bacterium]
MVCSAGPEKRGGKVSEKGDKKRYWVGFNRVYGIGPARLDRLLTVFGDIEDAWNASPSNLGRAGLSPSLVNELIETRSRLDLDEEMGRLQEAGFQIITWQDPDYPERLREINAPPPVLYCWGELTSRDRWAAALVGTRQVTPYGRTVTEDLAATLAANGVTVVSGMARGIDGIAHRSCLDAGGRTLAVLGSGLDQIYPPEHTHLAERICQSGAVLTDYPLGTKPEGRNFPPRNRIISGLSLAVVIVEAGEGSGALITADFAAEQGRELFAVPGSIYSPMSRGTNRLIQSGARPLNSADDLLEGLNLELITRQEQVDLELPEDETERRVYKTLSRDPLHVDEIQIQCGLEASEVTAALAMLEIKGRVQQVGGMQYVRARERRAGYRIG